LGWLKADSGDGGGGGGGGDRGGGGGRAAAGAAAGGGEPSAEAKGKLAVCRIKNKFSFAPADVVR
jgi:hypothetical protein